MKYTIPFLFFLFFAFLAEGQEINLKSAVVATAGSNPDLSKVNISKWRLGEVHSIVIKQDELIELQSGTWEVNSYPNPFNTALNLNFKTIEKGDFTIVVTDIQGKRQLYSEEKTILPNQNIQLDLAFLSPALYLVTVFPKDKSIQKVFKVQKN